MTELNLIPPRVVYAMGTYQDSRIRSELQGRRVSIEELSNLMDSPLTEPRLIVDRRYTEPRLIVDRRYTEPQFIVRPGSLFAERRMMSGDGYSYSSMTPNGFYRRYPMYYSANPIHHLNSTKEENQRRKELQEWNQDIADTAIREAFGSSKEFSECAIEMTSLTQWTQVAVAIPCKHLFKWDALLQWYETNDTCPLCRASFTPYVRTTPRYMIIETELEKQFKLFVKKMISPFITLRLAT